MNLTKCVIVGGAGAVGTMFADLLSASGREVYVIDKDRPTNTMHFEKCDIINLTPEARRIIQAPDMVLLALPERVAIEAVPFVCTQMREGALLVHTLSVQSRMSRVIETLEPSIEVVGLNPMFAPSLSIVGRSVAAIVQRAGPYSDELLGLISSWGGQVTQVSAEEHDKIVAAMQVLTHATVVAFGAALGELEVDMSLLSALAPPPHTTLLALLARIVSGTPEVYWDIQSANPHAPIARNALLNGVSQFISATRSESEFVSIFKRNQEMLGPELEVYKRICAQLFSAYVPRSTDMDCTPWECI
jgi:4-amino-4-deoxyprephenate dehydrogenase